ncbi:hypothetical protein BpHYR1_039465 [Brachionus plicatilis]|uniref:Uncharacterized protein n=1 Tax=Brachionus plicatilis TaxID=10195 RepID=A0A3M7P9M0_BRAPC|nr:hypothetical protein BpHYR1_039465 [Brachionus plicatilis]
MQWIETDFEDIFLFSKMTPLMPPHLRFPILADTKFKKQKRKQPIDCLEKHKLYFDARLFFLSRYFMIVFVSIFGLKA